MKAQKACLAQLLRLLTVTALVSAVCLLMFISACAVPLTVKAADFSPSLSGVLQRGLPHPGQASFSKVGIAQAMMAIDFTLLDTKGESFSLSNLLFEKPVVLIIGSFT